MGPPSLSLIGRNEDRETPKQTPPGRQNGAGRIGLASDEGFAHGILAALLCRQPCEGRSPRTHLKVPSATLCTQVGPEGMQNGGPGAQGFDFGGFGGGFGGGGGRNAGFEVGLPSP